MKHIVFFLSLALSSSALAQGSTWSPSPRQFPGLFSPGLTVDQADYFSSLLLFPFQEFADSQAFNEAIVLEPITFTEATLTSQDDVNVDLEKIRRAKDAYAAISHFDQFPALQAYDSQLKVVKYFEALRESSAAVDRAQVDARLLESRQLLKTFQENLLHQTPSEIQAAILRRAHRDLSYAGFPVPDLKTFLVQWPVWVAGFANSDFLKVRLHLKTGLSPRSERFLDTLQPIFPGFQFRRPQVTNVFVTNSTGLKDYELMSRAHIERPDGTQFDLVFSLTFNGVLSLFTSSPRITHIPYDLGLEAVAEGRSLTLRAIATSLCLSSSQDDAGAYRIMTCGGS